MESTDASGPEDHSQPCVQLRFHVSVILDGFTLQNLDPDYIPSVVVVATIRVYYASYLESHNDILYNLYNQTICASLECSLGVIVGNLPVLRPVFSKALGHSPSQTARKSSGYHMSSGQSGTPRSPFGFETSQQPRHGHGHGHAESGTAMRLHEYQAEHPYRDTRHAAADASLDDLSEQESHELDRDHVYV